MAARRNGVWSTCGVHPHHAEAVGQSTIDQLSVLAKDASVRAWGEMDSITSVTSRPEMFSDPHLKLS